MEGNQGGGHLVFRCQHLSLPPLLHIDLFQSSYTNKDPCITGSFPVHLRACLSSQYEGARACRSFQHMFQKAKDPHGEQTLTPNNGRSFPISSEENMKGNRTAGAEGSRRDLSMLFPDPLCLKIPDCEHIASGYLSGVQLSDSTWVLYCVSHPKEPHI